MVTVQTTGVVMVSKGLVLLLGVLLAACGSSKSSAPTSRGEVSHLYVEQVESARQVRTDQGLEIKIKGNLPSPAYEFERYAVEVKGHVIEITPIVKYDSTKLAAQVLVPFERSCQVGKLPPGEYEVRVLGKKGVVTEKVKVER